MIDRRLIYNLLLAATSLIAGPAREATAAPRRELAPAPLPTNLFRGFHDTLEELRRFEKAMSARLGDWEKEVASLDQTVRTGDHTELARRQRALADMFSTALPALDTLVARRPQLVAQFEAAVGAIRGEAGGVRLAAAPACAAAAGCDGGWCEIDVATCRRNEQFAAELDRQLTQLQNDSGEIDALLADMAEARGALHRLAAASEAVTESSEHIYDLTRSGGSIEAIRSSVDRIRQTLGLIRSYLIKENAQRLTLPVLDTPPNRVTVPTTGGQP